GNADIDPIRSTKIKKLAIEAYERGGINTFSWHMPNYNTGQNFYDVTPAVASILPGGDKNEIYRQNLKVLADFFKSLEGSDGEAIPVIFRPFHEHTGNWFWWGKDYCTPEEYISLWRYTVEYLKNEAQVHNVLYAYSPDRIARSEEYMERYPGDQYVDILGIDNYWEFQSKALAPLAIAGLNKVVALAQQKNKPAALTETGLDQLTISDWFTQVLLASIKADNKASQIAYLMVWRNGNSGHFFGPYPGHESAADFLLFYQDPFTLFENDLGDIYDVP
ncbi:MAG: glycosyl hydrolase, partial [Bacteroidota bacterium]